ncbi:isoprenylcysteine carboxyl methyltransferase family protein [Falsibacillus albus]|uniref:Isoprenylcysteine carboxyl methyltransferase n=1 Tax=Falsibacillus albus TaxID=2478915 RepID=A0A3L7JY17_9BACI|nr:isoprenylcysteine carboxylmethyltransferase family protein [Falsibacillus albus]RLQ95154.1 hypothetical protein D9X91_11700 [Falsibacillus albus]
MFFYVMLSVIAFQRIFELIIARRNEKYLKAKGAIEFGKGHYRFMVLIHVLFFVSMMTEVDLGAKFSSPLLPYLFTMFLFTQAARIWAISSLGEYWNTKIIVLPEAKVPKKGPYKLMRHPNYLIVTLELLLIPMMFHAYFTLFAFTVLNALILSIRIPIEEKALSGATNYETAYKNENRFLPKFK